MILIYIIIVHEYTKIVLQNKYILYIIYVNYNSVDFPLI